MLQESDPKIVRTESIDWIAEKHRDLECRYKDLSGKHIGARIEELSPGSTSSYHHYHTSEEEHVFILTGEAVLFFGDSEYSVAVGDHIWFQAGDEIAHHFENRSESPCTYLVYGERKSNDVVMYPDAQVMLVKALDRKQFTYRVRESDDSSDP